MQFNQETSCWGPGVWLSIHISAYRADKRRTPQSFIIDLKDKSDFLPCLDCRRHCKEYITKIDPLDNVKACLLWSWKFHDKVNERIKNAYRPTFEELYEYLKGLEDGKGCEDCKVKPLPPSQPTETVIFKRQVIDL